MTVGIFFSLGHCSVVVILCGCVMVGSGVSRDQVARIAQVGGFAGPWVGAAVLALVGLANIFSARDLYAQYQQRTARSHEHEIVSMVGKCCPTWISAIDHPSQVFWIGLLFGLGLDTASEIALLTISALAHPRIPQHSVMLLPFLFAAGMALVDTVNGLLMLWAYEWARDNGPSQRIFFSLFLTIASAAVALIVASLEAVGAAAAQIPSTHAGCTGSMQGGEETADSIQEHQGPQGMYCVFWETVLWLNDHLEVIGLFIVVGFFATISSAVCIATRCVPSQSQIEREDSERERALLQAYLSRGQFIVRFE